jgi:gliding motility-associated-like protein
MFIQNKAFKLFFNYNLCIIIALLLISSNTHAQQIKLLNIADTRGVALGYNLYGYRMVKCALPKLLNPKLFGPAGIVKYTLAISSGFGAINSITDSSQINGFDVIFIGLYSNNQNGFSANEIKLLLSWSQKPGKVLVIMEQVAGFPVTQAMGYNLVQAFANPTKPAQDDATISHIFSGPFGNVTSISQNGNSEGFFQLACGAKVLGTNSINKPAIVFDPYYRDILWGDTDYFTDLGVQGSYMENDSTANTGAEIAWCNLWAWVVSEVVNKPPTIILPPVNQTVGQAVYNGPGVLPICDNSAGGQLLATGIINGLHLLAWETSTDNGATWQETTTNSGTYSFTHAAGNQLYRFVTGTDTTFGNSCRNYFSAPIKITSIPAPRAGFSVNTISKCLNNNNYQFIDTSKFAAGSIMANWQFGDGLGSAATNPYHAYASAGVYPVRLNVSAGNGCSDSITQTVQVYNNPVPLIQLDKSALFCLGDNVQATAVLSAGGAAISNYQWYNGAVAINPPAGTASSIFISQAGQYAAKVTDVNGCDSTAAITLTQKPKSFSNISMAFCKGQSFDGHDSTGIYTDVFAGAAANGCDSVRTLNLTVYPLPLVDAGPYTILTKGSSTILNATVGGDIASIEWSPVAGLNSSSILNPTASPLTTTTYTLKVETTNNCTNQDTVTVKVVPKALAIPNVFSPNGDGINDVWNIANVADYPGCMVDVFNRGGQPVFHSEGYLTPWNGTYNGKPLPVGVYYYVINPQNGFAKISGWVTILR